VTCCVRSERKTENLSSGWSRPLRNLQRKLGSALLGNVLAVLEYSAELGLSQLNHVKPIGTQVLLDLQSEKKHVGCEGPCVQVHSRLRNGSNVRSTGRGWCRECLPQQGSESPSWGHQNGNSKLDRSLCSPAEEYISPIPRPKGSQIGKISLEIGFWTKPICHWTT
jgi:hypothetical protein